MTAFIFAARLLVSEVDAMKDIADLPLQAEMEHIDTTTCKKVLEWMDVHQKGLPRQFRKTVTDAQRPEYLLRNKFKYIKRKTDHAPEVRALLDLIERRTSMDSDTTTCKTLYGMDGRA